MEKAVNSLSGPTADIVKEAVRREEEQQQQQLQQTSSVTPGKNKKKKILITWMLCNSKI